MLRSMGTVIDHLMSGYRITVIKAFTDARGVAHVPGEFGVIRQMGLEWPEEIWIEWEQDGANERMLFRLDAREGPRSGAMREFFERGDYVPQPRPAVESSSRREPELPKDVPPGLISDPSRYEEAVERVAALAAHRRFEEAEKQILQITGWPSEFGWRCKEMAQYLTGMAAAHVEAADPTVYVWLRGWAVHAWYMWGSGATSGGEGAAYAVEIRAGEKILADLDKRRQSAGLRMNEAS
jgi:hypothetical protein